MKNPDSPYGWLPDVPDHRDYMMSNSVYLKLATSSLPTRKDPIDLKVPIDDQKDLGSCTGHAVTTMMELNYATKRAELKQKSPRSPLLKNAPETLPELSRLMAYYLGRVAIGTEEEDSGAQIRDVIKGMMKTGSCSESLWGGYSYDLMFKSPGQKHLSQAEEYLKHIRSVGLKYVRMRGLYDVRIALDRGYSVAFGFAVPETIHDLTYRRHTLPTPGRKTQIEGGHAVLAVGYTSSAVIVRNSWGDEWGNNGRFLMPYAWFRDLRRLVDDMWCLM